MVEATVSVGIVAKAADQDIDDLVLPTNAEKDKMFYDALCYIEEEQLKGKTDKEVTEDEHHKETSGSKQQITQDKVSNDDRTENNVDDTKIGGGVVEENKHESEEESDEDSNEGSGEDRRQW